MVKKCFFLSMLRVNNVQVEVGRQVVKNGQNLVHLVFERPPTVLLRIFMNTYFIWCQKSLNKICFLSDLQFKEYPVYVGYFLLEFFIKYKNSRKKCSMYSAYSLLQLISFDHQMDWPRYLQFVLDITIII